MNELNDRFLNSLQIPSNYNTTDHEQSSSASASASPLMSPTTQNQPSANAFNTNSSSASSSSQSNTMQSDRPQATENKNAKEPCTIYKINLDFLNHAKSRVNKNFFMNQLCENSMRTIQRDISNYSSQFIFNDNDDTKPNMNSIYQKIISSNVSPPVLLNCCKALLFD